MNRTYELKLEMGFDPTNKDFVGHHVLRLEMDGVDVPVPTSQEELDALLDTPEWRDATWLFTAMALSVNDHGKIAMDRDAVTQCIDRYGSLERRLGSILDNFESRDGKWYVSESGDRTPIYATTVKRPGGGIDGTHRGPADYYPDMEQAIVEALAQGPDHFWQTEWMSCKHEILSSRISCAFGDLLLEVSVSNDFDIQGKGDHTIPWTDDLATIETGMWEALRCAEADQDENNTVEMYSIGKLKKDVPEDAENQLDRQQSWEFTYLVQKPTTYTIVMDDQPPGDHYHRWWWQEVPEDACDFDPTARPEEIPRVTAEALSHGMDEMQPVVVYGDYIAILRQ